ncbi:hypothetical protein BC835DRAFT_1383276 [Cytidiella melzeri]|nr:hypothetical protein BC835DRAFT_1383276 [Cytidiella melzeri]
MRAGVGILQLVVITSFPQSATHILVFSTRSTIWAQGIRLRMSDATFSPEKTKPLRATYAGRMKKKQQERQKAQTPSEKTEDSEKEEDGEGKGKQSAQEEEGSTKKTTSPPVSKRSAPETIFAIPETPITHQKPPSSVSSVVSTGSSKHARKGSTSSVKGKLASHANTEDTESISDTESAVDGKQRRKRKSEAERVQFFKDDPWCQELEPHRILCSQCGEWQELHSKRRYVMQGWVTHRKTCPGVHNSPSLSVSQPASQPSTPLLKATPLKVPTTSSSNKTDDSLSPMEEEGKTILENDSRIGAMRPHEVFCTQCATWVKLYPTTKYSPRNWQSHVQQCFSAASPSAVNGAVAAASESVQDDTPSTAIPFTSSIPTKTRVDSDAPPSLTRKRARDDSQIDSDDSPSKRHIRRRTDSYKPSLSKALWNMVTKPIVSFIEGFKHGLKPDAQGHAAEDDPGILHQPAA